MPAADGEAGEGGDRRVRARSWACAGLDAHMGDAQDVPADGDLEDAAALGVEETVMDAADMERWVEGEAALKPLSNSAIELELGR